MKAIIKFVLLFAAAIVIHLNVKAQTVKLSSLPSAKATVFLDFDGEYITGTSWNWSGPIDAKAASLNNTEIAEIFNRVAEDYRPFNLNITTSAEVYLAAPFDQRIRIVITPTSAWYGRLSIVAEGGQLHSLCGLVQNVEPQLKLFIVLSVKKFLPSIFNAVIRPPTTGSISITWFPISSRYFFPSFTRLTVPAKR